MYNITFEMILDDYIRGTASANGVLLHNPVEVVSQATFDDIFMNK
jgi:hypothetical protein